MQIDYSSVVIFPDSMAIGRIVHYNFSVSLPGNHGYGLTIVFLLYEQIDVVMYSCFSAYKCIDTPTAVQKHLYRCFRQHFKNLTCIKISDHKIAIYLAKVTSFLPYVYCRTERFNVTTDYFSKMFEESRSRCLMTSDDVHPEALTCFYLLPFIEAIICHTSDKNGDKYIS